MTYKQYLTDLCLEWFFFSYFQWSSKGFNTEPLGMGGVVYCEEFIGLMNS